MFAAKKLQVAKKKDRSLTTHHTKSIKQASKRKSFFVGKSEAAVGRIPFSHFPASPLSLHPRSPPHPQKNSIMSAATASSAMLSYRPVLAGKRVSAKSVRYAFSGPFLFRHLLCFSASEKSPKKKRKNQKKKTPELALTRPTRRRRRLRTSYQDEPRVSVRRDLIENFLFHASDVPTGGEATEITAAAPSPASFSIFSRLRKRVFWREHKKISVVMRAFFRAGASDVVHHHRRHHQDSAVCDE